MRECGRKEENEGWRKGGREGRKEGEREEERENEGRGEVRKEKEGQTIPITSSLHVLSLVKVSLLFPA